VNVNSIDFFQSIMCKRKQTIYRTVHCFCDRLRGVLNQQKKLFKKTLVFIYIHTYVYWITFLNVKVTTVSLLSIAVYLLCIVTGYFMCAIYMY